jgi:hypothetical protein
VKNRAAIGDEFFHRRFESGVVAEVVEQVVRDDEMFVVPERARHDLIWMHDVHMPAEVGELRIPAEQIHAMPPISVHFQRFVEAHLRVEQQRDFLRARAASNGITSAAQRFPARNDSLNISSIRYITPPSSSPL